jgi:hypothetical protein
MNHTPKVRGFLASEKCRGLFLYRRTNKTTYLISFNYEKKKDRLSLGSGFYGKLYPNRCDISPDGEDFIYFAMGSSLRKYGAKYTCWTAVCKLPEIKAYLFIGQNDTWGGGGVFLNRHELYINRAAEGKAESKYNGYKITYDQKRYDTSLHYGRGWEALKKDKYRNVKEARKTNKEIIIERVMKEQWGRTGEYSMFTYMIKDKNGNEIEGLDKVSWCDFDNFGRLITASGSKIKIYDDIKSLKKNRAKEFDLEELVLERKSNL